MVVQVSKLYFILGDYTISYFAKYKIAVYISHTINTWARYNKFITLLNEFFTKARSDTQLSYK